MSLPSSSSSTLSHDKPPVSSSSTSSSSLSSPLTAGHSRSGWFYLALAVGVLSMVVSFYFSSCSSFLPSFCHCGHHDGCQSGSGSTTGGKNAVPEQECNSNSNSNGHGPPPSCPIVYFSRFLPSGFWSATTALTPAPPIATARLHRSGTASLSSPSESTNNRAKNNNLHSRPSKQQFTTTMVHQTFYDSIVLFGDSITQYASDVDERGFGAQLGHVFQRRLDVINRGFSGYTTEQAIHLLPQILPHRGSFTSTKEPKIQFLTIFFGANDACLPGSPQHVPLQTFEKNLRILLDMVHNPSSVTYSPHTRVILIVAPVIDEAKWLIRRQERKMMMDRDETVAKEYATLARKVGLEYTAKGQELNVVQEKEDGLEVENKEWHKVHVIDTYTLMEEAIERNEVTKDQLLKDGLHLGPAGNDLIFTQIMAIIRTHYPQYDPDTMPMHAPWWGDLDRIHPEKDLLIATNRD